MTEVIVTLPDESERRYTLAPGEYLVGRDPSCQIVVDSPDVSQRHAKLRLAPAEFWLEDLGSSNGSFVAGERLAGPIRLRPPQRIDLGKAVLEIRQIEESDRSPAAVAGAASPASDLPGLSAQGERYAVGRLVAQGGMGAVLDAQDAKLQRRVALKRLRAGKQASRESLWRFVQEARVLGQLEHPNIVPIHDLGVSEDGELFYTMKLVKGVTLHQVLAKIKAGDPTTVAKYALAQLLTIFQKVCDAVSFAHSRGVIHRDLKPENIMLGEYGEVLVMDWGLAKILAVEGPGGGALQGFRDAAVAGSEAGLQTLEGRVMGTPNFMAPEQAEGRVGDMDARTDLFALGGILYHILTLSPPVSGGSTAEILEKIKQGAITPPSTYNQTAVKREGVGRGEVPTASRVALLHCPGRKIPAALSAVAMKALARDPAQRYQTVAELQRDLGAYQAGFATAAEGAGVIKQVRLLIQRHRTEFGLAAAGLLIIVVLVAGFTIKVTRSLAELRQAAPAIYTQATALVEEKRFPEALETIAYALSLLPNEAEYYYLKGNICESLLRFKEAGAAYLQALAHNPNHLLATENLKICQTILSTAGGDKPSSASLRALRAAMIAQGRSAEAVALRARIGKAEDEDLEEWRTALAKKGVNGTLTKADNGMLKLVLTNSPISDLSPLKGLPLTVLEMTGCTNVADLRPLKGLPLTRLWVEGCPVEDLTPLLGMRLKNLGLLVSKVTDLAPLRGMPVDTLALDGSPVADLSALQSLPINWLQLSDTKVLDLSPLKGLPQLWTLMLANTAVQDFTPLLECRELDNLVLPSAAQNIECLRRHPRLRRLDYSWRDWNLDHLWTKEEFWKAYDAHKK